MKRHVILVFFSVLFGFRVDMSSANDLFVADYASGCIYQYTPAGSRSTFASGLDRPYALAFDSSGNLYATFGSGNDLIDKFLPDGSQSVFATGVNWPVGLACDPQGDLFAMENAGVIDKFSPDGTRTTFGTVPSPMAIACDGAGNVFVSSFETNTIYKFTPNGIPSTFASAGPSALACDSQGNLFAANIETFVSYTWYFSIYKFTPSGSGSFFASDINSPTFLAVDKSGNVFETQNDSHYIYEYTPTGSQSIFASGLSFGSGLAFAPTVPEPSTFGLLAAGTIGLLGYFWRRRTARTVKPQAFDQQGDPPILAFPSHSSPASAARRAA